MANGGWGGLGQAWGQSMAMDRRREEKERKKDRRNMWLMQLVGAPVAQGITEGVAGLINEPFKDAALDFFKGEEGQKLYRNERAFDGLNADWKTLDQKIIKSEKAPDVYFSDNAREIGKQKIDAEFRKFYGEDFAKQASYHEALAENHQLSLRIGKKEAKEYLLGKSAIEGAHTPAQRKRAYEKWNPYSKNWGQATVRGLRRLVTREDFQEYENRRVRKAGETLGLLGTNPETGEEYFTEFSNKVKDGMHVSTDSILEEAKKIVDKRLRLQTIPLRPDSPDFGKYVGATRASQQDIRNNYTKIEEQNLYHFALSGEMSKLQRDAADKVMSELPESMIKEGRLPRAKFLAKIEEMTQNTSAMPTEAELKIFRSERLTNKWYAVPKAKYVEQRVAEDNTISLIGDPKDRAAAASEFQRNAQKEYDDASESAYRVAFENTQNMFYTESMKDPREQSDWYKDIMNTPKNQRRTLFLGEVKRRHEMLIKDGLVSHVVQEGKGGRGAQPRQRTVLILDPKKLNAILDTKLSNEQSGTTETHVVESGQGDIVKVEDLNKRKSFQFMAAGDSTQAQKHKQILEQDGFKKIKIRWEQGDYESIEELQKELDTLHSNFVDSYNSKVKDSTTNPTQYKHDPNTIRYPTGSAFEKIQSGVIYDPVIDDEVNRVGYTKPPVSEWEEFIGGPYRESQEKLQRQVVIENSLQALTDKEKELPDFFERSTIEQRQLRDKYRTIGRNSYKKLAPEINASPFLTSEFNKLGAQQFVDSYVGDDGDLLIDKIKQAQINQRPIVRKTEPWVNRYPPVEDSFAPESSEEETLTPNIEPEAELDRPPLGESFREAWSQEGYTPTETVADVVDVVSDIVFTPAEKKKILAEDASPSDTRPSLIAERKTPVEVNDTQKLAKALTEQGIQIDEIVTPFESPDPEVATPLDIQGLLRLIKADDKISNIDLSPGFDSKGNFNADLTKEQRRSLNSLNRASRVALNRYQNLLQSRDAQLEVGEGATKEEFKRGMTEGQSLLEDRDMGKVIAPPNKRTEIDSAISDIQSVFKDPEHIQTYMKRIAAVESAKGENANTYKVEDDGFGAFQITKTTFRDLLNRLRGEGGYGKTRVQKWINPIEEEFGIDVTEVKFKDMVDPKVASLMARLLLKSSATEIPKTLEGQAELWKKEWNSLSELALGTVKQFIRDAKYFGNK